MADKDERLAAVNMLIYAQDYNKKIRGIRDMIANYDEFPTRFYGVLSPLNSLVDIGLSDQQAFNRIVALIERKRRQAPQAKRRKYQANLMLERRHRLKKAIELQELTKGVMSEDSRAAYGKALQLRWRQERDAYVKAKGDISWAERNEAASEFWAKIDETLDHNLAEARRRRA